jgi:hypothetical protein
MGFGNLMVLRSRISGLLGRYPWLAGLQKARQLAVEAEETVRDRSVRARRRGTSKKKHTVMAGP